MGLSPICLRGCGQEVGHCESLILNHKDLYIFFKVSHVTIFTTPKGGAPINGRNIHTKEEKKLLKKEIPNPTLIVRDKQLSKQLFEILDVLISKF